MASDKRKLTQLEDRLRNADYVLRYERGHFQAGFCVVHDRRVIVINKFFDAAARLHTLTEIVKQLALDDDAEATHIVAASSVNDDAASSSDAEATP